MARQEVCLGSAAALRISFISLEGAQGRHCFLLAISLHARRSCCSCMRSPLQLVWRRPRWPGGCGQSGRDQHVLAAFRPQKAYPCALSSPRSSRSRANSRWSRPTAKWRRSRKSDMVGRPISGSRSCLASGGDVARDPCACRRPRLSAAQYARGCRSPFAIVAPLGIEGRVAVAENWNRATENLYSAWIEKLFDAPVDVSLSWPALQDVCGTARAISCSIISACGKTKKGFVIRPDCADLPYFLRAYFAFKLGLPFGYSKCTRGAGGQAPKCSQWWNVRTKNLRLRAPG